MSAERDQILNDVHSIILTTSIGRGAALSSTPEQIVWMTGQAIAENLRAYANGEDAKYRWFPREQSLEADIRRAIENSKMSDRAKDQAMNAIAKAVSGWPA